MQSGMLTWAAVVLGVAVAAPAVASQSAEPARKLVSAMRQHQWQHVAAKDPAEPGRYVAAMLVGEGQLLVISGRYGQPVLLNEKLFKSDFQGVYMDLNAAADREGRLFVQDLGQPGLHPTRSEDGPYDIVYDEVVRQTAFDGDWKAQKLSREGYQKAFESADGRYARALQTLLAALAAPAATAAAR